MFQRSRTIYRVVLGAAIAWVAANCLYTYLILQGNQTFRVESAAFILVFLLAPLAACRPKELPKIELTKFDRALIVVAALGVWLAVLLPRIAFPFLSDDYGFLNVYRGVGDVLHPVQFFRPAFALLFAALARLGGGSPIAFHVISLLLHVSTSWIVYSLTDRVLHSRPAAMVAFVIYLLNPLQLEPVLWPSGLQELLWTFFLLAALRCYVGAAILSGWRLLATTVLVAAALLSKETAVCFVLLLPAADWALFGWKRGRLLIAAYGAFALELVMYLLLRSRFTSIERAFLDAPSRFFIKQFLATPYKVFIQPWNASAVNVPPVVQCLTALGMLGLVFNAVRMRAVSSQILYGPAVILMSTLPVYRYFFVRGDLLAARYVYFAAFGWALLLSELLVRLNRPRIMFAALTGALIVLLGVALSVNVRPWDTAADLAKAMEIDVVQGKSAAASVADWQKRTGITVEQAEGVPTQYQGVAIFLNGYDEFLRMSRTR